MSLHCRKANSQQGEASAAEPMKPRAKAVQKKQQPRWQGTRLPIVSALFSAEYAKYYAIMIENAQRAERQGVLASQCLSLEIRDAEPPLQNDGEGRLCTSGFSPGDYGG